MGTDPAAPPGLAPGTTFGKYSIVRRIGSGGMGDVYEARHVDLQKRVALKTLHADVARSPEMRARFLREGQTATRLRHPNVVDISDVGIEAGVPYLVMEYLEGQDLASLIEKQGPLPFATVADVLLPVISAAAAAHDEGVVHRDLKPENIFLARERDGTLRPILLDFGISKVLDAGEGARDARGLTGTGSLLGTPYYMSPEQATGSKNVDARSDQYALGVILYECVTGSPPFSGATIYSLLHSIVEGTHDKPSLHRADLPPAVENLIERAMSKDPAARFDSVRDLGQGIIVLAEPLTRAIWERKLAGTASGRFELPTSDAKRVPSTDEISHAETLQASSRNVTGGVRAAPTRAGSRSWLIAVGVAVAGAATSGLWLRSRSTPGAAAVRPAIATPAAVLAVPRPAPSVAAPFPSPTPPPASPVAPVVAPVPVAAVAQAEAPDAATGRPDRGTAHQGAARGRRGANGAPIVE